MSTILIVSTSYRVVAAKWGWVVDVESSIAIITINEIGVRHATSVARVGEARPAITPTRTRVRTYCRTLGVYVCELEPANHINFVVLSFVRVALEEGYTPLS